MTDIVIYGGTFNPIHNGHLELCRYVLDQLGFGRILLIPAASPPHKDAPQLAEGQARLELCRLAVQELPGVEVSDWEIQRGGKSYTVDTLRYLTGVYPHDRLFLLMGSDMFLTFREWKAWKEIGQLATLLVASRETDDGPALRAQQQSLLADGITIRMIDNPVVELSSTRVREQVAAGAGEGLVSEPVLEYIRANGLYLHYDLEALRAAVKPLLSAGRYHHTLCVERQAVHLTKLHGGEMNQAAAAAILHDCCKNMEPSLLLQTIRRSDIIYSIDFSKQPQLLHSYAGAQYIQEQLGIRDKEIINAVRYHTTGRPGMSLLEKIIYLADITSEERDYADVEVMRGLAERSLDEAMLYALEFICDSLPRRGLLICKDTLDALAEYRQKAELRYNDSSDTRMNEEEPNEFDT